MKRRILFGVAALLASAGGGWVAQSAGSVVAARASSTTPAGYITITPTRVLDTRTGPRPGNGAFHTVFPGVTGAVAVGVIIALTDTAGAGYVTAWAGDTALPVASSINSSFAGENISNFVIVPVAANGTFTLFANSATHIVVDVMGYFVGGSVPPPSGLTGVITGYGPGYSITSVVGTVSNGTSVARDIRADVRCPNGTVEIDYAFDVPAGETRGFEVICDGVFTTGASLTVVEI